MLKDKLVLLVDDEPGMLVATKAALKERGFRVEAAEGAEAAMQVMKVRKPSLVVSDLVMPGTNGFEFFKKCASRRTSKVCRLCFDGHR